MFPDLTASAAHRDLRPPRLHPRDRTPAAGAALPGPGFRGGSGQVPNPHKRQPKIVSVVNVTLTGVRSREIPASPLPPPRLHTQALQNRPQGSPAAPATGTGPCPQLLPARCLHPSQRPSQRPGCTAPRSPAPHLFTSACSCKPLEAMLGAVQPPGTHANNIHIHIHTLIHRRLESSAVHFYPQRKSTRRLRKAFSLPPLNAPAQRAPPAMEFLETGEEKPSESCASSPRSAQPAASPLPEAAGGSISSRTR